MFRKRRWSDKQFQLWPFTFSYDKHWKPVTVVIDSGHSESPGCHLRAAIAGLTMIVELPPIVWPWRKKIKAGWDQETIKRLGRDWYYDEHPREYGFSLSDGHFMLYLGAQTHDSVTTQSKSWFLPWTQWRFVRYTLYGLDNELLYESSTNSGSWEAKKSIPKAVFLFKDYDGKEIQAETLIEQMEWKFGEGWFKLLSVFRKRKISRSLDISFSEEVGPEKGSWKGGTVGHSIEMLPGEIHEAAFKRYCEQEHRSKSRKFKIEYIGKVCTI